MFSHVVIAALSMVAALLVAQIDAAPAGLTLAFGSLALWSAWCATRSMQTATRPILRLGGFSWDLFSFCRGWLIVGETGSGKTLASINTMLWQVSKNCPRWGGICIDDKGVYWETLSKMFRHLGREEDLILLKVRPDDAPADWKPPHTFNFLQNERVPFSTKAKNICDVAASLGQDSDQSFFKTQAEIQMDFAFRALKCAGLPVTLESTYELLSSDEMLLDVVGLLEEKGTPEAKGLVGHFETHIASQPSEQLGGVRGTLANRLKHFTSPDIAAVFCTEKSTFSFDEIDQGKVVCISIPQRFQVERRYIHTLMKLVFYSHVLMRFDRPEHEREKDSLLILWADEAQKIVTANEDGTSDYNVVDVIREAKATVVAATQSFTSLIPPMGNQEKAKVFIANMANRIMFKAPDEDSAKMAADMIGKRKVLKRTYGYSGGRRTSSYTEEEKYFFEPYEFRKFKTFEAVIQHCGGGFRRVKLPPLGADGCRPDWYR